MLVAYMVTEDENDTDDNDLRPVYGITARMGEEVSTVRDISADRSEVEAIARLLEREQLHPIHLYDVISDLIGRF